MKKIFFIFTLAISFFLIPTASAEEGVVRIVDTPHQTFNGKFRNDELASELAPEGKLGKLLLEKKGAKVWIIDPVLVDEIIAMSKGYTL